MIITKVKLKKYMNTSILFHVVSKIIKTLIFYFQWKMDIVEWKRDTIYYIVIEAKTQKFFDDYFWNIISEIHGCFHLTFLSEKKGTLMVVKKFFTSSFWNVISETYAYFYLSFLNAKGTSIIILQMWFQNYMDVSTLSTK